MVRALAILAALGSIGAAILSRRADAIAPAPELAPYQPEPEPEPETAPIVSPEPVQVVPARGRLSPAQVLALAPVADPDGWMPYAELLAFVEVESAFRPEAYRFEPHLGVASYGLMQVLETTARDRGLVGDPRQMFEPVTGLRMGILAARWSWDFLSRRLGREPTEAEWVGSYNAGVGNVLRGFIPQGYYRRWQLARDRYARGS